MWMGVSLRLQTLCMSSTCFHITNTDHIFKTIREVRTLSILEEDFGLQQQNFNIWLRFINDAISDSQMLAPK